MMNTLKKLSIRYQLIALATATIIIMIFSLFTTYFQTNSIINENNSKSTSQSIYQFKSELNSKCDLIYRVILNIFNNTSVQKYIYSDNNLEKFNMKGDITDVFFNSMGLNDDILDIAVISNNGVDFDLKGYSHTIRNIVTDIKTNSTVYYTGIRKVELMPNIQTDCIFAITTLYSTTSSIPYGTEIGKIVVVLDAKKFVSNIVDLSKKASTRFYIFDSDKHIYPEDDLLNNNLSSVKDLANYKDNKSIKKTIAKASYIISVNGFDTMNSKIISLTPENELLDKTKKVRYIDVIIFFVAFILICLASVLVANNITSPLDELTSFMKKLKYDKYKGLNNDIKLNSYAEIEIMADHFNNMLNEIDSLTEKLINKNTMVYELELGKKQSELAYLRSQINPHFLYNTLESIKGIAGYKGVPEITDMTQALGDIFRYSIKGSDTVLLQQELDIVKAYLRIQQIRFSNRFKVKYNFSEEALKCMVPKMILQPIIENAIHHGLELKYEKGLLTISAFIKEDNSIDICVEDNGMGIEPERLNSINLELAETYKKQLNTINNNGIGLINVNNRLRLIYGEQYGIKIDSKLCEGTKINIIIPRGN